MNLVFVDELLNHFNYTGDIDYVKKMWPLLKLHLEWEKEILMQMVMACTMHMRPFGPAMHCNTAAVVLHILLLITYWAIKAAAMLAKLIGEDGSKYEAESQQDIYNHAT